MFRSAAYTTGLEIEAVATCDFDALVPLDNEQILARAGRPPQEKLLRFFREEMQIARRFYVPPGMDALDLARDALRRLLEKAPHVAKEASFLVFAGISSPMPTVCIAALLANEFAFENASCWDLKSGCSTGVLALTQAIDWVHHGARTGVVVASETFSRFTDPKTLELAASTGDGAAALAVKASSSWKVRGVVHGTDARFFKSAYVPGKYPVDPDAYRAEDYVFAFDDKGQTLAALAERWVGSLKELLAVSEIPPERVTHYFSHQVDGKKNTAIARACNIPEAAIAKNFERFGNMGCPTIFVNYLEHMSSRSFAVGDVAIFHAVGGGISSAGICLEKIR